MAEVVTGEAVILDLAIARFPSRLLAQLIDIAVELPVIFFLYEVIGRKATAHLNAASAAALTAAGLVLIVIAYPVTFETLSRGKTLGKLALGIRVVSDDGGPERFRQAFIRALSAAFIEIWLFPINLIGMLAWPHHLNGLGEGQAHRRFLRRHVRHSGARGETPGLAAGFTVVPPPLFDWASHVEMAMLPDQTAAMASSYLRRYRDLRPSARIEIGARIATTVSAYVSPPPPPGTPPEAYLAAVLAIRRDREQAAMMRRQLIQQSVTPGQRPQPTQVSPAIGQIPVDGAAPPFSPVVADQVPAGPFGQSAVDQPGPDGQAADSPPEDYGFAAPF